MQGLDMNFADQEEIAERQKQRHKKTQRNQIWDILSIFFLIATVAAICYFAILFANPASSANPFPPPTLPALIQIPTSTPTPVRLPPTWTPNPTNTATPAPTATSIASLPTDSTGTPLPTSDQTTKYSFAIKGDPIAMANTVFHPDLNCNWQGIAGQVLSIQGSHMVGYRVHLQGYYNGKTVDLTTLSGGAQAWYGESGYEFKIGDTPIDSTGQLTLQLEDQSGLPMSDKVSLNTYSDCNKNLVLVYFQQVK
jgi:hypothetical protein